MNMLVLTIGVLLGAGQVQSGQDVMSLMPQPDTGRGWRWDLEPEMYDPETLFEYINGEAEHYNDYDFVEMATASHARVEDEFASVTIDIYDMGNPLNAFGIYSSHRRPELEFGQIGEEAIVSELNISFYKGRFFVQVSAGSMDQVVRDAMREQAVNLAAKIEAAAPPRELLFLPVAGQMPQTLQYLARGLLGQAAFERGLQADYRLPSGRCSAFVVPRSSGAEAEEALHAFVQNLVRSGQMAELPELPTVRQLSTETEYFGKVLAEVHGAYVVGVTGFESLNEASELLGRIKEGLR